MQIREEIPKAKVKQVLTWRWTHQPNDADELDHTHSPQKQVREQDHILDDVLEAIARLSSGYHKYDHITPVLRYELHVCNELHLITLQRYVCIRACVHACKRVLAPI